MAVGHGRKGRSHAQNTRLPADSCPAFRNNARGQQQHARNRVEFQGPAALPFGFYQACLHQKDRRSGGGHKRDNGSIRIASSTISSAWSIRAIGSSAQSANRWLESSLPGSASRACRNNFSGRSPLDVQTSLSCIRRSKALLPVSR